VDEGLRGAEVGGLIGGGVGGGGAREAGEGADHGAVRGIEDIELVGFGGLAEWHGAGAVAPGAAEAGAADPGDGEVAGRIAAAGDVHYAQGDGEVSGTAIEMGAVVTVVTEIRAGLGDVIKGPQSLTQKELSDFSHLWLVVGANNDGAARCHGRKPLAASIGAKG
jgi:hypothetical protein